MPERLRELGGTFKIQTDRGGDRSERDLRAMGFEATADS
jgi:hypothetical protein